VQDGDGLAVDVQVYRKGPNMTDLDASTVWDLKYFVEKKLKTYLKNFSQ
jgi:hypothetical protein